MKWIGVTGSWRKSCPELEHDLVREVKAALQAGYGIVTGGALGVDSIATALALKFRPDGSQIRVILPTTLGIYAAHYQKRADEGVITSKQAEDLIKQLKAVNELGSLVVTHKQTKVNETTYYLRNTEVVNASDELLAFQVNQSAGTGDTVDKARHQGKPVKLFTYTIE